MVDPWLGFLNEQVAQAADASDGVERAQRRQQVLDRAACSFPFPLEIEFRGTVIERLMLQGEPHLVLAPSGLDEAVIRVVGGIVVPSDRRLFEGSIVEATVILADPDSYWLDQGILSIQGEIKAIVPIEP